MGKPITNKDLSDKLDYVFATLSNLTELLTPLVGQIQTLTSMSNTNYTHLEQRIDILKRRQDGRDQEMSNIRIEIREAQERSIEALHVANQFGGNVNIYQDLYGRIKEQLEMARNQIEVLTQQLAAIREDNDQ